MIILCDTRQKKGKHKNIETYCKKNGISLIPHCLQVGDYMLSNGKVSVDTKQDLKELANDLYADKKAFNKKYRKSLDYGIRLVVLVEEEITSLSELCKWSHPKTRVSGRMLLDMIHTLTVSYGIKFIFCKPTETAKKFIEILSQGEQL